MSRKLQLSLDFDCDLDGHVRRQHPEVGNYRIVSRSLDARRASRGKKPRYNYVLEYDFDEKKATDFPHLGNLDQPPLIVGAGPAGLFCALRLSEYGISSIIVERGDRACERMKKIACFWRYGEFDPQSNVCFGEGGAGLFSDGKLISRIRSPFVKYVMRRLVDFGAPKETAYRSDPHLGSNIIRSLITKISHYLTQKGCQIFYNSQMVKLLFRGNQVEGIELACGKKLYSSCIILATGHSARDVYSHLFQAKIALAAKDFAVGVRVEHPRGLIDRLQHGSFCGQLETAKYRLSYHDKRTGRGCYSFCMCPGGYVLSAGTEANGLVTNGMSNFSRHSPWSNAALVVSVKAGQDFQGPLGGIDFQRAMEVRAYRYSQEKATGRELPVQRLRDFLESTSSKNLPKISSPSHAFVQNIDEILPSYICEHLRRGLVDFNGKIPGFICEEAILYAPETRTSAPVRIERDLVTLESVSIKGLYPCGEGAGFAGGITSAAVDGIRVAMKILEKEKDFQE